VRTWSVAIAAFSRAHAATGPVPRPLLTGRVDAVLTSGTGLVSGARVEPQVAPLVRMMTAPPPHSTVVSAALTILLVIDQMTA
jgi:hypothetical protein